jgi:hypothetical protein
MTNPNKLADALAARDAAIQEARGWKMEAQTANATIAEIYRLVGSKAGNWNGAKPVREALAGHDAQPAQGEWVVRLIGELSDALDECDKITPLCDCRDNDGDPYPSQWLADVRAKAAGFLSAQVTAPQPAHAPVQMDDSRSWPEDAQHENGDYECECVTCGRHFIGHKRRHVCKACAHPPAPAADGAGELLSMIDDVAADLTDHKSLAYEKLRKVRAAIATLRQPVPDAVRDALRECELFVRMMGLDSEPARKTAESARAALASQQGSRNAD